MSETPNFSGMKEHVLDFGQKTNYMKLNLMANFTRHLQWCSCKFDKDFICVLLLSSDQIVKIDILHIVTYPKGGGGRILPNREF